MPQQIKWYEKYPKLFKEIQEDLKSSYKTLLFQKENDNYSVIGFLIIEDPFQKELGRYNIKMTFTENFPREMPKIFEISNKIPCTQDRHKYLTNECCLCLPDEVFFYIEKDYTIIDFIEKIVKPYFLWQLYFDLNSGVSIFKHRGHGESGIIEFYKEKLKTDNINDILRFLKDAQKFEIKGYLKCYCGSDKKIKKCCRENISDLKNRIQIETIKKSYESLYKNFNK